MDRFMRQVATYHTLGHGTIGAKKNREQKIAYNRFITQWRQRISTAVQRAIAYRIAVLSRGSHPSGGFQDHDYEAGMEGKSYAHSRRE
eukprot:CAMPEP_0182906606 /NCGR_PEP_ID=MMETSP0034_2-20130328/33861_1 /TAXON_ID=156128 /ORGANISM="Nephroselmis pyriformis, Strain CCMP717" /LENGTH=87 /DNA_ID=CAMNT_0025042311 /DNA_START=477 /DNA_END=740 /DNA_ORIENTATION=+